MTTDDVLAVAFARVLAVVYDDAREDALFRLELAYQTLTNGGRLDVVANDLRWTLDRVTAVVDHQLAVAERVLNPSQGVAA